MVVVVVLALVEKGTAAAGVMVGEAVARRAKRKGADRRVEVVFILGWDLGWGVDGFCVWRVCFGFGFGFGFGW